MKRSFLVIGFVIMAAVAFAADQPKQGAEWTDDKANQYSFKKMEILVTRVGGGDLGYARNYHLDLPRDKVRVTESDNNAATLVNVNNSVGLELRKDPKGAPSAVCVDVNKCAYLDLNCDGVWDAWCDGRDDTPKRSILVNDRWVRVRLSKAVFRSEQVEYDFHDPKTEYVWDGKVWKAKPAKP